MTAEMDVYGGEVSSPKDLSNCHANVGGSFVFVNGNDDPLDSDLTSKQSNTNPNLDDVDPSSHLKERPLTHTDLDQESQQPPPHYSANAHHQQGSHSDSAVAPTHQIDTQQHFHTQEGEVFYSADSDNVDVQTTQTVAVAPVSIVNTQTEPDIGFRDERETETGKITSDSHPVDNEVDHGPLRNDSVSSFPYNGARLDTETTFDSMDLEGEVSTLISGDSTLKSMVSDEVTECNDDQSISVDNAALESGSVGKEISLPTFPGADVKMGSEFGNKSVVSSGVIPGNKGAASESDILNGSVISSQNAQNCVPDVVHEGIPNGDSDVEIQLTAGGSDGKMEENGEIEFTGGATDDKTCRESEENTLQELEVQFTGGEDKTCQEGEIQFAALNDNKAGQEGQETGEISGEENDDKTGQEGQGNGEIQFTGGESDGKTCQEEDEEGDDKISQKVEEDNVEIQFTGEGSNGKTCMEDNSKTHAEIQFASEGGSDDKICHEREENRGEEIADGEENRGVEIPEGGENRRVEVQEGEENRAVEIQEREEYMEGEIQFTALNDDNTGQERQQTGEINGEEKHDKPGQEVQESGEIQFTAGKSDGKTCREEDEEGDDKISQKVEGDNVEIQFTGEESNGKTCMEDNSITHEEIQFTGEGSDGKICQEREENGGEEITEGEVNRGEEITDGGENSGVEIPEGEENRGVEVQEGEENRVVEIQEGEEYMEGEIRYTGEGTDDRTCQKIEDGETQSDANRAPQNIEVNEETQFADGEKDDKASQFIGGESGGKAFQEEEGVDGICRDETPLITLEGSTLDASEMQNSGAEVVKRRFYFLIKVPRYDDENLREQINCAQLKVDEKTKSRDVTRAEIQTLRDSYKKCGDYLEAAMSEEKAARELLKSKRQEIDSLQSMINKVKNAISIEDIDGRIRNMEHMIAHETLPLKEEKQFIREIKQLKQLREQFSSSMGKQDEVQHAFDQKDQIEGQLKLLRKEADSLRENVLKAEAATQAAKKKQKDESEKLKKLYTQFKVADDVRQEAYKHLQSLRKQANDKNKYFWKYKDDIKQANDLVSKGDKEALQHLCVNQVERVLELWNNNNEFREQYVSCNIRSTLRRLKTLDGRSLGPDEVPPVIPPVSYNKVAKDNSVTQISGLKEEKTGQVVPVKSEKVDDKPIPTVGEQKNQTPKSKRPAKLAHSANGSATVSGRDEIKEAKDEEPKRTKEEEELARKAEELRKEEEAAKLKEQRRLEEKIKAKEALERKKRIAEKAQARSALRAQKEAEEKEKEREKRARKKEKRKAAEAGDADLMNEGESAPSMETTEETPKSSDVREKSMTVTKRPQKSSQFTKQTKVKSIPLPLRNRGKRRMQTWMWVLLTAMVIVALFLLGNSSFTVNFGLQGFVF